MVERVRRTRVGHGAACQSVEKELKYAVHPGTVFSIADGQNHFIPSDALMHFYGVDPAECLVVRRSDPPEKYEASLKKAVELNLIPLVPQITGNYALASAN